MVAARWILSIYFLIRMSLTYEETSFLLFLTVLISSGIYTIECLMIAKQIKEIFDLIQENKKLTHTIKTILQTFPEGVIIRSPDEISKSIKTKFTNDFIHKTFNIDPVLNNKEASDIIVWIVHEKENSNSMESEDFQFLDEFLSNQEWKWEQKQFENFASVDNIIEIRKQDSDNENCKLDHDQEINHQIFNVKTIQVWWENNSTSYMHVFINTTEVRKLEEMKAKNKCQKLMFASASHEFRTPLNAFMNSLTLIDITIGNLKEKVARIKDAKQVCEPFYPTLDKMITIGKISSKLLMNLVEDILDLAKFDANRFELNIGEFKMKEVVSEINSIFMFQWQERKIDFKIEISQRIYK